MAAVTPGVLTEDLVFAYGQLTAVDHVGFSVAPGEIVGLLGPNGAGKSTTIKMLTGQLRPAEGRIEILGMAMPRQRTEIQRRIGVCFEEKNLYLAMTAEQNLRFFARLFGIRRYDPAPMLERVGLAERAKDHVREYSKGMRQRLMMARTLVNEPDVLFLDEPTDGLDPVSARMIRQMIRDEATRGVTVVLTTHDMMEADQLSDRVAFINDGRILTLDTPEHLKLAYGRRSVRVRSRRTDGTVEEQVLPLDAASGADLGDLLAQPDVLTVHSEEASLEDVFVHFAGRGLDA